MFKSKRFIALLLILILLTSVIVGCTNDGTDVEETDGTEEAVDTTETDEVDETEETEETEEQAREITPMEAGEYLMEVEGYKPMEVKVTLGEKAIEDIEIVSHNESEDVSEAARRDMPVNIVEKQRVDVDTITGATFTSNAISEAAELAIEEAGGVVDEFKALEAADKEEEKRKSALVFPELPSSWDETYDVIVVGGGFAGLSASYEAASQGAKTLLIDKMPVLGGNSQINGGVYASYTSKLADEMYEELNLEKDTAEKHIEDTIIGGDYMGNEKLVENFVYGSPYFLDLMLDNGLEVRDSITRPGGHYGYRTYTTINGVGADIVKVQKDILDETDTEVMLNTKMEQIYRENTEDGKVVGIMVSTDEGMKNIEATQGLILTTGGFAGNVDMRSQHVPALTEDIPTTNHVGATGEGITMAQEIGANTTQMAYIQLYPFADPNNGRLDATAVIPFSGPSSGVVYVDVNGERYVNEGERRDVCARAAQDSAGFPTFAIFGKEIVEKGGFIAEDQLAAGMEDDRIFKADTIEELTKMINDHEYKEDKIDMKADALKKTLETHNGYVEAGEDPDFGKVIDKGVMLKVDEGPYYAIPQWPSVHHTMGGLVINDRTEVKDIWGDVIPGLYAAGEVAGGVHGTNRLGSNAIPDAAVHGIIAARVAVKDTMPEFIPEGRE